MVGEEDLPIAKGQLRAYTGHTGKNVKGGRREKDNGVRAHADHRHGKGPRDPLAGRLVAAAGRLPGPGLTANQPLRLSAPVIF
jgi:hypothetical protein